jgi:hypothetical protein
VRTAERFQSAVHAAVVVEVTRLPGSSANTLLSATIAGEVKPIAAVAALRGPATLPEAAPLLIKLHRNLSNAVITIYGDSTGQGDFTNSRRWPLRFATSLAAKFPAYTVNFHMWNNGTNAYNAPVVIQTGTGPRKLDVYNGSASRMTTGYSLEHFATMSPVVPDVAIVSHAHNQSPLNFLPEYSLLPQRIQRAYPGVPVVLMGQNPRWTTDAGYAAQRERVQAIAQYAAREGFGFIDAMSVFELDPNPDANLIADGTHPTEAGYKVWADEVMRRFEPDSAAPIYGKIPKQDAIFYPAHVFEPKPVGPSKSIGTAAFPTVGWAMDPTTPESLVGWVDIPYDWPNMNVYIYWTTHAEATGFVMWELFTFPGLQREAMPLTGFPVPRTALVATSRGRASDPVAVAAGGTEFIRRARFPWNSASPYRERGLHGLRIQRVANTGADTLKAADAIFLGIMFERV